MWLQQTEVTIEGGVTSYNNSQIWYIDNTYNDINSYYYGEYCIFLVTQSNQPAHFKMKIQLNENIFIHKDENHHFTKNECGSSLS